MAVRYQDFGWQSSGAANSASGELLADTLLRVLHSIGNVRRICDLGCGNGYLAGRLAAAGYEVTGVDLSPTGIQLAQAHHPKAEFICAEIGADLAHLIEKNSYDLVITSDVIEHLYRPSDLLDAASVLLRRDGHLIVGTPYHGYLKNLLLSLTGKLDAHFTALWDGGHIKFFSVKTLSALIEQHGFTRLQFFYYGRVPYLWKNMICHARKNG